MIDIVALPWEVLLPFIIIGFLAQLLDGSLGLGFGIMSNALLLLLGMPPAHAAAAVRSSESFVSGLSGLAHAINGNIDWPLFGRLVVPGIVGGLAGVWILLHVRDDMVRPVILVYLAALGVYLTWRAPRREVRYRRLRFTGIVAFAGGAVDASGGGWGAVVTGSLLAQGANPRTAIGTTNAAEFFVTVTVLAAFIGTLGLQAYLVAATGLLLGGAAAAPIGPLVVRRAPPAALIMAVGVFLIASSFYGLLALVLGPIPNFPRL